jgi:hypothetical protein
MIEEIKGDLLTHPDVHVIAHCANCFHTMGSGVAKFIREKYPEAYKADCNQTKRGDIDKLGTFSWVQISPELIGALTFTGKLLPIDSTEKPKIVANVYGQYRYGRDKRYLNYEAIFNGMQAVKDYFNPDLNIGIPHNMGCKNAGGDWRVVRAMMDAIFLNSPTKLLIINNE